jgi:hypothetical protein
MYKLLTPCFHNQLIIFFILRYLTYAVDKESLNKQQGHS